MTVDAIARRYIRAHRALVAADYSGLLEARYELDDAFHQLCRALDEPCPACDIGDCPYFDDDAFVAAETVADPGRLLND